MSILMMGIVLEIKVLWFMKWYNSGGSSTVAKERTGESWQSCSSNETDRSS
jgi:hypothetical protein